MLVNWARSSNIQVASGCHCRSPLHLDFYTAFALQKEIVEHCRSISGFVKGTVIDFVLFVLIHWHGHFSAFPWVFPFLSRSLSSHLPKSLPRYYLPKFTIFGKYVRLSVCLSVCLSVSLSVLSSITHECFDISSPNLVHIWNGWAVPVCDIDK